MKKKLWIPGEQVVIHGRKTIRIGWRRNVAREFEKLRFSTHDTIIFEDIPILRDVNTCCISGVRRLVLRNVGILDHGIFSMDDLETLIICGTIGKLRPWSVSYCRKLRTVIIDANVFSCDGYLAIEHCPKLEHVIIRGVFPENFIHTTDNCLTYKGKYTDAPSRFPYDNYRFSFEHLPEERKEIIRTRLLDTSKWVVRNFGRNQELDDYIGSGALKMWGFISDAFNSWNRAYKIRKIGWEYDKEKEHPSVKTLKRSAGYASGEEPLDFSFRYAPEDTFAFRQNRRIFHLRKISGKGYDYIRMMRLCRWVHDSIRHDGHSVPDVYFNLQSLMWATSKKGKPGNCFVMAMCLNEALLSVGIKARYIKGYPMRDENSLYHVFVAAWSRKLNKWIFLDPTYGAWVKDMEGNLLSPAEIRHNLLHDVPMHVNPEADYNGSRDSVKTYLSHYLAPYMYYMLANTLSQDETEGRSCHSQGKWITLTPKGERSGYFIFNPTSDDRYFWQPPQD